MNFVLKKAESYNHTTDVLSGMACRWPFRHLDIHVSGGISICCHAWLPEMVVNILEVSTEEILENTKRLSILNDMQQGKFSKCNDICPFINESLTTGYSNRFPFKPIDKLMDVVKQDNYLLFLSYDQSCNLQCPSCRKGLIFYKLDDASDEMSLVLRIHEKVKSLVNLLIERGAGVTLVITGSGDPFASPLYWHYIKELSTMALPDSFRIRFVTNGVLMTDSAWKEIEPLWKHISFVGVTIDAVTEETYKKVRKNGNFAKLKKNLTIIDDMVAEKKFPNLQLWQSNFVVQRDNYHELADFVRWQLTFKTLGRISPSMIIQWGHLSDEEYKSMTDMDPEELSQILSDPIFKDRRVQIGNLSGFM